MKRVITLGAILILAGCVTEPAKPRQWDVKVTKQSEPRVWVSKQDGSKQCGQAPASITPESVMHELKGAGIMVFQAQNGNDGMMHPAVCGAATGNTVELQIFQADLAKLQARGFKLLNRQN